jgi:hypothetical protein
MPRYTITGVADQVREWSSSQGGLMKAYRVDLKGADGSEELLIEWSRKATSDAPTVGLEIDADVQDGQYGKRLKLTPRGGQGGVWGGARPEDPQRQKRIVRQHSQNMAIQTIALALQYDIVAERYEDGREFLDAIFKLADHFDADVERAAS